MSGAHFPCDPWCSHVAWGAERATLVFMRRRRHRRALLVACNLLALAVVFASTRRSAAQLSGRAKMTTGPSNSSPPAHQGAVAHASSSGQQGSNSSNSSSSSSGSDGGRWVGACCAALIGSMKSSTETPVDYSGPEESSPEPSESPPTVVAAEPVPAPAEHEPATIDLEAARRALEGASRDATAQCGLVAAGPAGRTIAVRFERGGHVAAFGVDPPLEDPDTARCVEEVFLRAEVPSFEGRDVLVSKSWPATTPAAEPFSP